MTDFNARLQALLTEHPELETLRQLFRKHQVGVWLVGGTLRDLILGRPVADIDFAIDGDPTALAKSWARTAAGRWFWLDEQRKQSRVLLSDALTVDFTPLRAATISADQSLRDYTINSLALCFTADLSQPVLLDPLGGQSHLKQRSLQLCSEQSVADDPLRMLKGVRHAVTLQMTLSKSSLRLITAQSSLMTPVAGERIKDELGKIFQATGVVSAIKILAETGLLQQLFGPPASAWDATAAYSELDRLEHKLRATECVLSAEAELNQSFTTGALFLLATLLRCYRPANLADLLHRKLRLSRQQQRIILNLQQRPSEHWFDLLHRADSERQKALLVEQLGYFPDEQMLYWAVSSDLMTLDQVKPCLAAYHGLQRLRRIPDLLDGKLLAGLLPRSPGKDIGVWQQRIKDAELTGEIGNRSEALRWVKSKISD